MAVYTAGTINCGVENDGSAYVLYLMSSDHGLRHGVSLAR